MTQKTVESIIQIFHNGEMVGQSDSALTTIQCNDDGMKIRSYLSPYDTSSCTGDEAIAITLSFTTSDFASFADLLLDRTRSYSKIATNCSE